MIALVFFMFSCLVALACGVMAAVSDVKTLKIPNMYPVMVLGAFVVGYGASFAFGYHEMVFSPWKEHLISGGVLFLGGFILFATGAYGAGDSKLIAAFGFWFGFKALVCFIFYTSLIGALVAVFTMFVKRSKPFKDPKSVWLKRVQEEGARDVPYGVAIAIGAVITFVYSGFFSEEVLVNFVSAG